MPVVRGKAALLVQQVYPSTNLEDVQMPSPASQ